MANKTMHHLVIEDNNYEILDAKNRANIAAEYSASSTYKVGDVVLYNGQLYKCTTAITTAEAWTAAHWTAVTVGGELSSVKDGLNNSFYPNEVVFKNIAQSSWYASGVIYYPMPTLNVSHVLKFSGGMKLDGIVSGAFFEMWYSNATDGSVVNVFSPGINKTVLNSDSFVVDGSFTPGTGTYLAVFIRAQKLTLTAGAEITFIDPVMEIDGEIVNPITAKKYKVNNNSYDLSFNFSGIGITRKEFDDAMSSSSSVITDGSGNLYKLFVQNGGLKHRKAEYKKVLCFGNSITKHPVNSSIGWLAERGMASTTLDMDYAHLLETGLKVKNNDASVDAVYSITWEQNFSTDVSLLLDSLTSNNYDLVVIQVGENVPANNVSNFEDALCMLINDLSYLFPNADFMLTDMFSGASTNATKRKAIYGASVDKNTMWLGIIDFLLANKIALAGAWCKTNDETDVFPLVNSTVWTHPSDLYMLKKANGILSVIGYDALDIEHGITVSTSLTYQCHSSTVAGSLVTCCVYTDSQPNVTVKDASNNNVPFEIKSYSGITWVSTPDRTPTYGIVFEMPDSNVTITIS